jgi:DNA-binding SARP family transcriptional activator/class 3 adenylate cyclase
MLELRVLGRLTVLREGKPIALPPSRKTRALLAYLAVVGEPQRREMLCRMFWDTPDDLRGALRWSLSKLRRVVNIDGQEVLAADREGVALSWQSIALDLSQIRELSQRPPASDVAELEKAADSLKGGFLENLSLPRCHEFEAWRLTQANDVDLLRVRVLRTLIERLASEPSRALPHARALQAVNPMNSALAAEVKRLTDLVREQTVRMPPEVGEGTRQPAAPHIGSAVPAKPATIVNGERQHVTVLSIEIVSPIHGFAAMTADAAVQQMDPLFESGHGIIDRHGGIVIASGNSSITALFGSTGAGNHAVAACRAALAAKSAIETQSAGIVRVRAGMDSGEAIVRHRRHGTSERIEVTGAAVRTATRLVHALRRGVLALTGRTQAAAAGLIATGFLPRSDYPRFHRDEQVHELLGEKRPDTA